MYAVFLFFLYDLASAHQISSKLVNARQSYNVISVFHDDGLRVGNLLPVSVLVIALILECPNPFAH